MFLPVFLIGILNYYCADRIIYSYTSIIGLSFIFIILFIDKKSLKKLTVFFVNSLAILVLIIDILNFNFITKQHKLNNIEEFKLAKHIVALINNYEENTGNKIEIIEFCYDSKEKNSYLKMYNYAEATRRALAGDWCFENVLSLFINSRNFKKIRNQELHSTMFNNQEWDSFSDEQIKFKNERMYYCIY